MKWKEIGGRLNGLTFGGFGAQWTPKPMDAEIARRVVRYLEDRRVLYNDYAWEEPTHCVQSVFEIRRLLTNEITNLKDGSDVLGPLRVMRAACRKFLDSMQQYMGTRVHVHHGPDSFHFHSTLGEFRGAVGPQIALLAAHYQIDIDGELTRTLPMEDLE